MLVAWKSVTQPSSLGSPRGAKGGRTGATQKRADRDREHKGHERTEPREHGSGGSERTGAPEGRADPGAREKPSPPATGNLVNSRCGFTCFQVPND